MFSFIALSIEGLLVMVNGTKGPGAVVENNDASLRGRTGGLGSAVSYV
jgi:hypothetical protein